MKFLSVIQKGIQRQYVALSLAGKILAIAFLLTAIGAVPLFIEIPNLFVSSLLELFLIILFLFWLVYWLGLLKNFPRIEGVVRVYTSYAVYFYMTDVWVRVILYTSPFRFIDPNLKAFAHDVGFSLPAVMNFVYQWPWLVRFTWLVYGSLGYEVMLLPLVLALLGNRKAYEVYLGALIMGSLIGGLLYFLFPTTDPSAVYHDAHFILPQIQKVSIVHDIHKHIYLKFNSLAVVGFPSFHVMWATLISLAFLQYRKSFIPIAIWNILIILSTMGTGWHYLGDVLGGLVLGVLMFVSMTWLQNREGVSYPTPLWIKREGREKLSILNLLLVVCLLLGIGLFLVGYLFG